MRILAISDLHLDHYDHNGIDVLKSWPAEVWDTDICVLAGDLSDCGYRRWPSILQRVSEHIDPARIHAFPGNHDYYKSEIDREDKLAIACQLAGVNWSQKKEIIIDGVRLLTCTLWTDFEVDQHDVMMSEAHQLMTDYRKIRVARDGYRKLIPLDSKATHFDHRKWLEGRLEETFPGKTVVVTHHAPHLDCLPVDHPVPGAYASDLSTLIARNRPANWLHGHVHRAHDFTFRGCQISNVSIGYPGQYKQPAVPRVIEI
ncbi:metallophosphoesterase [Antarcticimicrobium sediminis]|uniref:Calcineurin-like phosphoesterase domain-containing protein n=1 Tax=Antarcticimicrobium sediminis TaxID=2546227 RepID=A0A4R5EM52_9RHOB|nr:metallophosphoesterase [Antarcticimicrobium sediminis]TDE35433.1 hypothetical protein E1B25_17465 [Antarcticimicrobium sediminis]